MSEHIEVEVLNRSCAAGDAFAAKHLGIIPKTAVLSCEGACLKGEIARRAANLVAHELAPESAVRICHGGALLLNQGGMRELVETASRVVMIDGCPLGCGKRLLEGAFPTLEKDVVIANTLYGIGDELFGTDEMTHEEIDGYARHVAHKVASGMARAGNSSCKKATQEQTPACCG